MGQSLSDEQPRRRSREELIHQLVSLVRCRAAKRNADAAPQALRFKDRCFTSLEFYSLKDVFKGLADQQGSVRYLKEDTVARYLEIPDILGASPVVFQMVSHLGAFPFLQDAPVVLELPQMIMVVVIMTERYRRVLAKGPSDRTKLLFRSMAVYDRKASTAAAASPPLAQTEDIKAAGAAGALAGGFAVDAPTDDDENGDDDDDDLVLTAYELLDITEAVKQDSAPEFYGAMIPTDNFRKLLMLLLLAAPLEGQESLSQYSSRVSGEELDGLRSTASNILAAFVDAETSPGIRYRHFKAVIPVLCPNLFNGFNGLFEHFLFSKNLDFSKHTDGRRALTSRPSPMLAQPLLPDRGEILNDHVLSQVSMFLPGSSLFRRVRRLYSGNHAGFSMGSFESKVFNWRAPTILLVSGTRLGDVPDGGQESSFAESLPTRRFSHGSKSDRLTFGVYIREPWKHTHKECFGDSETVLFQLEPIHDVFPASTINTDYVAFTKPPGNQSCLSFGCPHPKPSKSHRRDGVFSLGAVSLLLNDSFEFGVFNHDFRSRGGAFHTSLTRKRDFQDRFQIERLEVWGCGGDAEAKAQAERWTWEEREAEARRKINLGSGDIETDRALLEMAGLVGANRSGGSMA
ncbi:Restriction of telomere capping protein 5 [Tolypocladium capitatum]|uniref:Restriction of telomere capping protein 5 n=1 Tax=Tolypocladium capitatum TaxID=45235 RepID=A0A2K3QQN2_9HYPO|nr:Restriction of telomere capping protein 5 [Tolypocladium capitatum]